MDNSATNDYPINELIERRWSPRLFSDEPVENEVLCSLFEAARWAPSCYNDQPWYFILGTRHDSPDVYDALLACLVEENREWAKTAPVLALSVARTQFEFNDEPNRHALHDVGLAVENLVIEATDRGLFVHQMAGFVEAKAETEFDIPDDHEPVAAMAIGYPPTTDSPSDEPPGRERNPLETMVFGKAWDEVAKEIRE